MWRESSHVHTTAAAIIDYAQLALGRDAQLQSVGFKSSISATDSTIVGSGNVLNPPFPKTLPRWQIGWLALLRSGETQQCEASGPNLLVSHVTRLSQNCTTLTFTPDSLLPAPF